MIWQHVAVPVGQHAVTFDLLFAEVGAFDIEPSVVYKVSELCLAKSFEEEISSVVAFVEVLWLLQ